MVMRTFTWVRVGVALMLLWALTDNPYGYYQILRWVVCGVTGYAAYLAIGEERKKSAWTFGIIAVLFNPIAPIHLEHEIWAVIDVVVAGVLLSSLRWFKPACPPKELQKHES